MLLKMVPLASFYFFNVVNLKSHINGIIFPLDSTGLYCLKYKAFLFSSNALSIFPSS